MTEQDIAKIKEKNKKLFENAKLKGSHDIDFSNYKQTLKEFQEGYEEAENEEDKYNILMNYNSALEEFIEFLFGKNKNNFDNETIVEKYYIYIKKLFQSYTKILGSKELTKGDRKDILGKINEYINVFTKQNSGYLDNLIETLEELKEKNKKVFYEIILNVIGKLNECGRQCLQEFKKFCKYKSLVYFEKANSYFKKYIVDIKKISMCDRSFIEKCKKEIEISELFISDISSGSISLYEGSLNNDKLIESNFTGFTNTINGLKIGDFENEKYQIIMSNYEKVLIKLADQMTIQRALCIANIIKIGIKFLGDTNLKKYYKLGETCKLIMEKENKENFKWYKEFENIFNEIEEKIEILKHNEQEKKEEIKAKYKTEFDKIDDKYAKKKNNLEFINDILKLKPYKGYEQDINNKKINFNEDSQDLYQHLLIKYHPDNYEYSLDDEESILNYCLIEYIESYLNKIYHRIQ